MKKALFAIIMAASVSAQAYTRNQMGFAYTAGHCQALMDLIELYLKRDAADKADIFIEYFEQQAYQVDMNIKQYGEACRKVIATNKATLNSNPA